MVAVAALKAGIAGRLTRLDTAEEALEAPINPQDDILQDLRVDFAVLGHGLFDTGEFRLLVVVAQRDTTLPPGFTSLLKGGVVDLATAHQRALKHPRLVGRGLELVLEGFACGCLFHIKIFRLSDANSVARGTNGPDLRLRATGFSSPWLKPGDLSPDFR